MHVEYRGIVPPSAAPLPDPADGGPPVPEDQRVFGAPADRRTVKVAPWAALQLKFIGTGRSFPMFLHTGALVRV